MSISTLPVFLSTAKNWLHYKKNPMMIIQRWCSEMIREWDETGHYQIQRLRRKWEDSIIFFFFHLNRRASETAALTLHCIQDLSLSFDHMGSAEILMHHNGNILCSGSAINTGNHPIPFLQNFCLCKCANVSGENLVNSWFGSNMSDRESLTLTLWFLIFTYLLEKKNPSLIREPEEKWIKLISAVSRV